MTGESEEDASDYRQRLRESAEKVIASKLRERERKRIHDKNPNPMTYKDNAQIPGQDKHDEPKS